MQIGCGVYEHTVRNRTYLYFWHYETKGGRRVQMKEYVGPAAVSRSWDAAMRLCQSYYDRMASELGRLRDTTLRALTARGA